ncbi:MAG TPA: hypothetical protein DEF06_05780, partial [Clostridiales bacterium]|nr:hypothetical protein [Clostridiales bacterium]
MVIYGAAPKNMPFSDLTKIKPASLFSQGEAGSILYYALMASRFAFLPRCAEKRQRQGAKRGRGG